MISKADGRESRGQSAANITADSALRDESTASRDSVKKKPKPKPHSAKMVRAGELGRIYMSAPRDKAASSLHPTPRVRRFVPTLATAAVAATAEETGTFAFSPDMYDRETKLGDMSVVMEQDQD
jgi:hypothetical protein